MGSRGLSNSNIEEGVEVSNTAGVVVFAAVDSPTITDLSSFKLVEKRKYNSKSCLMAAALVISFFSLHFFLLLVRVKRMLLNIISYR